jgi:Copper type II ascorbate-dependent monooxygenase, C-terminal domain
MLSRTSVALGLFFTTLAACGPSQAENVTFAKDVAPILWKNCANCHRPGEIGPFPLLKYQDASKRADFIKDITQDRRMPPWKPVPGYGEFKDVRRLSDKEIGTLARWADAGAPEGDPKDLPPQPHFVEGWQLGKPDVVLQMSSSFSIPASGHDIYRNFIISIPMEENRTVAAVEFRPGNRRVVHHALFFLDSLGNARKRDGEDGKPGYSTFGGIGVVPTGSLGGWAPGTTPRRLPDGTGMYLAKGSELVLSIHYHPDGKPEIDKSELGIYFTPKPATTIVGGVAVRSRTISIPPGDSHYEVHAESQPLPANVKMLGIFPHMHNLGREMKVAAHKPDGGVVPLIWIRDWDFNWQGGYRFKEPVSLPNGTVIKVDAVYDNSSNNPKNPSNPPRRVYWGEQTTDEMCLCATSIVTETAADMKKIRAMKLGPLGAVLGGGSLPLDSRPDAGKAESTKIDPAKAKAEKEARAKILSRLPANGFEIPEAFRGMLAQFDSDHDGRLTAAEIEAMPEPGRSRVVAAVKMRLDDEGKK